MSLRAKVRLTLVALHLATSCPSETNDGRIALGAVLIGHHLRQETSLSGQLTGGNKFNFLSADFL
jgi:hypothetical protein